MLSAGALVPDLARMLGALTVRQSGSSASSFGLRNQKAGKHSSAGVESLQTAPEKLARSELAERSAGGGRGVCPTSLAGIPASRSRELRSQTSWRGPRVADAR